MYKQFPSFGSLAWHKVKSHGKEDMILLFGGITKQTANSKQQTANSKHHACSI